MPRSRLGACITDLAASSLKVEFFLFVRTPYPNAAWSLSRARSGTITKMAVHTFCLLTASFANSIWWADFRLRDYSQASLDTRLVADFSSQLYPHAENTSLAESVEC